MTAIDFPNTPSVNDTFTASGRTWTWTGAVWASNTGTIAWDDISSKPSTFTPSSHTHAESDVTNLVSDLAGKAASVHTHTTAQITMAVSDKSANYAIVSGDKNTLIRSTNSAITITIDNVLAIGEAVQFQQFGSGQITFAAGSGVTLGSVDSKLKTNKQHSPATVICVASGVYELIGDLAA